MSRLSNPGATAAIIAQKTTAVKDDNDDGDKEEAVYSYSRLRTEESGNDIKTSDVSGERVEAEEGASYNDDILRYIFVFLDERSLFCAALTCGQWKMLAEYLFLTRGDNDEKSCNFNSALRNYSAAIFLNPCFARAYNRRGNVKYEMDDNEGAGIDWRKAADTALQDPSMSLTEAKIISSKVFIIQSLFAEALMEVDAAIELEPTNADAYHQRGIVKSFTGDTAGEIEDFTKCIEIKRKLNPFAAYSVYRNRGMAYQEQKLWDKAIFDYSEAIRLQPLYSIAYIRRGVAQRAAGNIEACFADLNSALEINGNDLDALIERAYTYYENGQSTQALSDCDIALVLDQDCHDAIMVKAGILASAANYDGAIDLLTQFIERKERALSYPPPNTYLLRGNIRRLKGDTKGARSDFLFVQRVFADYEDMQHVVSALKQLPPPPPTPDATM